MKSPPLPLAPFFAFSGLSLAFTHEISQKHQELLATTADNKCLIDLILWNLQSEQVWGDSICNKGKSRQVSYTRLDTSNKNWTGTEVRHSLRA